MYKHTDQSTNNKSQAAANNLPGTSTAQLKESKVDLPDADSQVAQLRLVAGELNVVGEDHEESEDRRVKEKAFGAHAVGGAYWKENEFPAKSDTPERPADSLLLQAKFLLASLKEQNTLLLDSWETEDDDGEVETTAATDEAITNLQETCDEIKELIKGEVDHAVQDAVDWWAANGATLATLDTLYTDANSDLNPAIQADTLLNALPAIPTMKQASFDRGVAMNKAAKSQKAVPGVWKIGEHHIKEIKLMRNIVPGERRERDKWYNLVTQQEFNTEYDAFAAWVPPPPPPE